MQFILFFNFQTYVFLFFRILSNFTGIVFLGKSNIYMIGEKLAFNKMKL